MQRSVTQLHLRRNIDDHIARILVSSNVTDQPDVRPLGTINRFPAIDIPHSRRGEALCAQNTPERLFQHRRHDAAAHVAAAVAADQHERGVSDVEGGEVCS